MNWNVVFNVPACHEWPSLARRQPIPDRLKSRSATHKRSSCVGLGLVHSAVKALTGDLDLRLDQLHLSVGYESTGQKGGRRLVSSRSENGVRVWGGAEGASAPGLLALAEAALFGCHDEALEAWEGLLEELRRELGHGGPYSGNELRRASGCVPCDEAMMRLSDALYFAVKTAVASGAITEEPSPTPASVALPPKRLLRRPAPPASVPTPALTRLSRLVKAGGTALLVGPTGSLKTETAKRAVLEANARLVVVKGRAGLEDRDLFGAVVPTLEGPRFVDGPLAEAWRAAAGGQVVLVLDELLRFEPLYLGALVGALDQVSAPELESMGLGHHPEGRHYVLPLPTGEKLVAACSRLSVLATTNVGDDYVQFGAIDAALLGRFSLILETPFPEDDVLRDLYRSAGADDLLVEASLGLERWTRENTASADGLLARAANPRVTLSLIAETLREVEDGATERRAFPRAAGATVVPYCCPRTSTGSLDPAAVAALEHEVDRLARSLQ